MYNEKNASFPWKITQGPVIHGHKVEFHHCDMIKQHCHSSDCVLIRLFYPTSQRVKIWLPPQNFSRYETIRSLRPLFMRGIQNWHCGYVNDLAFTTNMVVSPLILICSYFEQRSCHQSYIKMLLSLTHINGHTILLCGLVEKLKWNDSLICPFLCFRR